MAVLATQIGHGRAGLGLLENADDPAIAATGLFYVESPHLTFNENVPLFIPSTLWGNCRGEVVLLILT